MENPLFGGGDGSSITEAVVINCEDLLEGLHAEHVYLTITIGHIPNWTIHSHFIQRVGGKFYEVFIVLFPDGTSRIFWFDIGKFYPGKP